MCLPLGKYAFYSSLQCLRWCLPEKTVSWVWMLQCIQHLKYRDRFVLRKESHAWNKKISLLFMFASILGGRGGGRKKLLATYLLHLALPQKSCSTDSKTKILLTLKANILKLRYCQHNTLDFAVPSDMHHSPDLTLTLVGAAFASVYLFLWLI